MSLAVLLTGVGLDVCVHLCPQGGHQHPPGSLADQRVEVQLKTGPFLVVSNYAQHRRALHGRPSSRLGSQQTGGYVTLLIPDRDPQLLVLYPHNASAFSPDGFYRTGDLVRLHGSGSVVVEGRKKDLINRGGEKISAEEVENLIMAHPAVLDAACVPVPDPVMGERMCACLVLKPGAVLGLEELNEFLLAKGIAKFKLPERLEVMDEFPTTRVGKVSKRALAEAMAAQEPSTLGAVGARTSPPAQNDHGGKRA